MAIKVLHLPSYHPAVSKIFESNKIEIVNPNTDLFNELKQLPFEKFINKCIPQAYDLVHIHFEYYTVQILKFEKLLKYFKKNKKPIVWTWHDKKSLLDESAKSTHEKLLFKYADKIITPTNGMKLWIMGNFGFHSNDIEVIPLGFMTHPKVIKKLMKKSRKDKKLFTMLIGDFRNSKEYIQSVINFLDSTELNDAKLQVIFRPINIYTQRYKKIKQELITFHQITQNPRVSVICKVSFSDADIAELFYMSHAVILPYIWGDHSGQIELARDCGCHAIVSDVGFYKEQNNEIWEYKTSDQQFDKYPERYVQELINAYNSPSLSPDIDRRLSEHKQYLHQHYSVYKNLISHEN